MDLCLRNSGFGGMIGRLPTGEVEDVANGDDGGVEEGVAVKRHVLNHLSPIGDGLVSLVRMLDLQCFSTGGDSGAWTLFTSSDPVPLKYGLGRKSGSMDVGRGGLAPTSELFVPN